MEEALEMLNRFREREGAAIGEEMRSRCAIICEQVAKMEKIRSRATAAFQKRLKERLQDLLRGASIEPQRLAQEAALLADRSDVSEELIRLKTHTGQVDALLQADGEVGKKLDFPAAGDESRGQYHSVEDRRTGRAGADHHRAGAGRQVGNR